MSTRAYKLIFALLGVSVLAILAVQGFWIRNLYLQKTESFDGTVYSALEQIALKLQERENLKVLEENLLTNEKSALIHSRKSTTVRSVTRRKDDPRRTGNVIVMSNPGNGTQIIQTISSDTLIAAQGKLQRLNKRMIRVSNKSRQDLKEGAQDQTIVELNAWASEACEQGEKISAGAGEINKLVKKLLLEVRTEKSIDEINCDTLGSLIRATLSNKGIFTPFEFSLRNVPDSVSTVLCQSSGFKESEDRYQADLSANKVFSTHNYLWIQFPNPSGHVWGAMKSSLMMSLLFSLLIIGVFYYTMQLILKQKKLAEVKNDFVNNMTHELKTPIATISLALDAINNPVVKNDEQKFGDYNRILKEENQKLNNHVERVLQMALLDRGELQLHKQSVNVVTVIEQAIRAHKLQAEKQGAEIGFHHPGKVTVNADEMHLQAVFSNLVDNALKYSKEKCEIAISVQRAGKEAVVSIKDNGIGISADMREKVFERFRRVQGGNLHDVKGFGLGLSYVRSIIEAHGGSISLQSEQGKGSEFIIRLQLHE